MSMTPERLSALANLIDPTVTGKTKILPSVSDTLEIAEFLRECAKRESVYLVRYKDAPMRVWYEKDSSGYCHYGDNPNYIRRILYTTPKVSEIESELMKSLHYPRCWDTSAYPTLSDAVREFFKCAECNTVVKVPDEVELKQAIARGWCSPLNSHKDLDADLANAITEEVLRINEVK